VRFYNRTDELEALERRWSSAKAEYVVIYGRRRVGKTELILRFAEGRRCIYFEASSGTERDHLDDLSSALTQTSGRELLAAQPLSSWQAVFAAVGEELENGPLLVALDEFQFVARETPAIGSTINRFWREHRDNPNLFLILSGSDVSFFEREIVGYGATTYGRRTGSLHLQPFPFAELRHFLVKWKPVDLIRAYAVFGGVPYYLEALDPAANLAENIERHVLAPDGLLRQEPRFLFSQHSDLREDGVYFSILRAIAAGRTRRNEIAARVGRSDGAMGQLLERLVEMGLVRRVYPVTVLNPDRTRLVRFAIDDPFLRFWFTFVHPYESRLHRRADAKHHLDGLVLPGLDAFVSKPAFEQICQSWLREEIGAANAGWWWGNVKEMTNGGPRNIQRELDAVAVDHEGVVLALGSCKWTTGVMSSGEKAQLRRLAGHLVSVTRKPANASDPPEPDLYLFSRSGFDRKLAQEAREDPKCHLVEVDELFRITKADRERP
jgi:AAA+ ATPase superfamily predicted ATPase